jgi:hypothetical protein
MTEAIRIAAAAAGAHGKTASRIPVRVFPWPLVTSPFVTLFREMREMRYLWREPMQLSNQKLLGTLGTEVRTPLQVAVRNTLVGLGCLQGAREELMSCQ